MSRGALNEWVDKLRSGNTAALVTASAVTARPESQAARIACLEAANAVLRAEQTKLAEERNILRQAAKYFAAGD